MLLEKFNLKGRQISSFQQIETGHYRTTQCLEILSRLGSFY